MSTKGIKLWNNSYNEIKCRTINILISRTPKTVNLAQRQHKSVSYKEYLCIEEKNIQTLINVNYFNSDVLALRVSFYPTIFFPIFFI